MATIRTVSPERVRELEAAARLNVREVSTDEILEEFKKFRPAWENGYF